MLLRLRLTMLLNLSPRKRTCSTIIGGLKLPVPFLLVHRTCCSHGGQDSEATISLACRRETRTRSLHGTPFKACTRLGEVSNSGPEMENRAAKVSTTIQIVDFQDGAETRNDLSPWEDSRHEGRHHVGRSVESAPRTEYVHSGEDLLLGL